MLAPENRILLTSSRWASNVVIEQSVLFKNSEIKLVLQSQVHKNVCVKNLEWNIYSNLHVADFNDYWLRWMSLFKGT